MSQSIGKAFTVQGVLTDISIANTGSGSQTIGGNQLRNYLMIHNPNATNIGVSTTTATSGAIVGQPGTVTLVAAGTLIYENGFIPLNSFQVCGSSGASVTIWQG